MQAWASEHTASMCDRREVCARAGVRSGRLLRYSSSVILEAMSRIRHPNSSVPGGRSTRTLLTNPLAHHKFPRRSSHPFALPPPLSLSHTHSQTHARRHSRRTAACNERSPPFPRALHTLSALSTPQETSPSSAGGSLLTGMARV